MREMLRDSLKIIASLAILIAAGFGGLTGYLRLKSRKSARSHMVNFTRQDLKNIVGAMTVFYEVDGKRLTNLANEPVIISAHELYRLLSSSDNAFMVLRPNDRSLRKQVFLDEWGREIHTKAVLDGHRQHFMFWSDGLNKKDDGGKSDDIVVTLDLALPQALEPIRHTL
jgi:hypothetical protein